MSYQDWQEKFLLKLLHRRVSICSNLSIKKGIVFVYRPSLTSPLLSDQVKQRMIEGRNLDSREQKFQDVGSNTVLTSCRMLRSCWRWFIVACVRMFLFSVWQFFIFKNIPCGQHVREIVKINIRSGQILNLVAFLKYRIHWRGQARWKAMGKKCTAEFFPWWRNHLHNILARRCFTDYTSFRILIKKI